MIVIQIWVTDVPGATRVAFVSRSQHTDLGQPSHHLLCASLRLAESWIAETSALGAAICLFRVCGGGISGGLYRDCLVLDVTVDRMLSLKQDPNQPTSSLSCFKFRNW